MKYEYGYETSFDGKTWVVGRFVTNNKRHAKAIIKILTEILRRSGFRFRLVRRPVLKWEVCK